LRESHKELFHWLNEDKQRVLPEKDNLIEGGRTEGKDRTIAENAEETMKRASRFYDHGE